MTVIESVITICICVFATMITRFLPFIVFNEKKETPAFVSYLGKYLPSAVFGMLVVYCLKDVSFISGTFGAPEIIGILVTAGLHLWKRNTLLSIGIGTAVYIILIQFIF